MTDFVNSSLWQSTLAARGNDPYAEPRERLRNAFLNFRRKAALLVSRIHTDMPDYTVHDITHLDALWGVASELAGESYPVNPAEAFVLGGAFLLHDAGMTLAAYPNGISDLKKTTIWKDLAASGKSDPVHSEQDLIQEALRLLHPSIAKKLPLQVWNATATPEYLIDDTELRNFYGPTIGDIAFSHWLAASDLLTAFPRQLGAMPKLPFDWQIDLVKVAAILRVADAAHIDGTRAPKFLSYLMKPKGLSAEHWHFQTHMAQCIVEDEVVIFSSSTPFDEEHIEAWWIAFDTISMINRELLETDILLDDNSIKRFKAKRVKGANNIDELIKFIKVEGWTPIDAKIKITNIPKIVSRLGGRELYGDHNYVPLRELMQNAMDAVRAKRILFGQDKLANFIQVEITEPEAGKFELAVRDTGVGMSSRVLTTTLLDFGESLWSSSMARLEYPGLQELSPQMGGRYGVGFFSVFMIADRVRVTSRKFDAALNATNVLTIDGLNNRPVLKAAKDLNKYSTIATEVCLELRNSPVSKLGILQIEEYSRQRFRLTQLLGALTPCPDVNIFIQEHGGKSATIAADDWKTLDGKAFIGRIAARSADSLGKIVNLLANNLRDLKDEEGNCYGRAAICPDNYLANPFDVGAICGEGVRICDINHILGILFGEPTKVARDSAQPAVPLTVLRQWASEQAKLCSTLSLDSEILFGIANVVLCCGGDPAELPIIKKGFEYLNRRELTDFLKSATEVICCTVDQLNYDSESDDCGEARFDMEFELDENIFSVHRTRDSITNVPGGFWPAVLFDKNDPIPRSTKDLVTSLLIEVWQGADWEEEEADEVIGTVEHVDIVRSLTIYRRAEPDSLS